MTWLLHEGIFHVEGVLKPAIFESLPWAYMRCKCPQILIGERHWPTELGICHLWSLVRFMAAQIWAINLAINFQYPHMIQGIIDMIWVAYSHHVTSPVVPCYPL